MKLPTEARIHILGIAGHAMRGVALAAKERGYEVTGTDETAYSPGSDWLDKQGITWWREADSAHVEGVDVIVLGGGVNIDHAELIAAQAAGIPVISYPELVSDLIPTDNRIVVAGTHGKTTTTSLIAWLLESAGRKPDFLVGIQPKNFESSVRLANGSVAVLEGDEYRSSRLDTSSKFEHYRAKQAIITSIEMDHPDLFSSLDEVRLRFEHLVTKLPPDGLLVYSTDSDMVRDVAAGTRVKSESYNGPQADWQAVNTEFYERGISFDLQKNKRVLGRFSLGMFGIHNVANATAALAIGLAQGLAVEELQTGASSFLGASRRFERITGDDARVIIIDDYAHHPTEVAATIAAAKQHFSGKVLAVFQPHTYSRTQSLLKEYQDCFANADHAYVVDIEGAREADRPETVTAADIATADNVSYAPDRHHLINELNTQVQPGDVILCMSVNGYQNFAQEINQKLIQ